MRFFPLVLVCLVITGCSTLKGWFTPQGQKLNEAQSLADHGHPLGASALAVEALILEPEYREARAVLEANFAPGQSEFEAGVARWSASTDADRWDRLVELYRWQDTLAREGASFGESYRVAGVAEPLRTARGGAAQEHWDRAKKLLAEVPGPRQARLALTEGRRAAAYDDIAGLADWLDGAKLSATQKLMVVPFFDATGSASSIAMPLASQLSRQLLDAGGLPELTSVFPADRLVTLPGAGLARLGLITQPEALRLAADAGQNIVLLGQITRSVLKAPTSTVQVTNRVRTALVVDPEHPKGAERVYKATVTTTVWALQASADVSFSVVEVDTKHDLRTAVRSATTRDETTFTSYTGDQEALTADDLQAIATKRPLADASDLWDLTLTRLAKDVASDVRAALSP